MSFSDQHSDNGSYWRVILVPSIVLVTIVGFYALTPVISNIYPDILPLRTEADRLQATSIFASTLLTLALLVVYREMDYTQHDQVQIMQNQHEVAEAEYRPLLDVEYISPTDRDGVDMNKTGFQVGLVNVGNGLAYIPRLSVELIFESEEYTSVRNESLLRPLRDGKIILKVRMCTESSKLQYHLTTIYMNSKLVHLRLYSATGRMFLEQ